jgi:hypothetical protein
MAFTQAKIIAGVEAFIPEAEQLYNELKRNARAAHEASYAGRAQAGLAEVEECRATPRASSNITKPRPTRVSLPDMLSQQVIRQRLAAQ